MLAKRSRQAEFEEGREAGERFTGLMRRILNVPKEELAKREAEYQESRKKAKLYRKKR